MSQKSRWLQSVEYWPIRAILELNQLLPFGALKFQGNLLGSIANLLARGAGNTAKEGLQMAFPDKSVSDIKIIQQKVFKHLATNISEFMQFPRINKRESMLEIASYGEYHQVIDELYHRQHGVIAIASHIGNWEILAAAVSQAGFKLNVVVRTLDNRLLDNYVERFRELYGTRVIPKQRVVPDGLKALRRGEILALLVDQNAADHEIFVPFFGKLASTHKGAAVLARKYKHVPLMLSYSLRKQDGTHQLFFKDIPIRREIDDTDLFVLDTTARITQEVETIVRKNPEQWMWLHPRWKHRPTQEQTDTTLEKLTKLGWSI